MKVRELIRELKNDGWNSDRNAVVIANTLTRPSRAV